MWLYVVLWSLIVWLLVVVIIDAGDDFVVAGLLVEVHVVVLVVGAVGVAVLVVVEESTCEESYIGTSITSFL